MNHPFRALARTCIAATALCGATLLLSAGASAAPSAPSQANPLGGVIDADVCVNGTPVLGTCGGSTPTTIAPPALPIPLPPTTGAGAIPGAGALPVPTAPPAIPGLPTPPALPGAPLPAPTIPPGSGLPGLPGVPALPELPLPGGLPAVDVDDVVDLCGTTVAVLSEVETDCDDDEAAAPSDPADPADSDDTPQAVKGATAEASGSTGTGGSGTLPRAGSTLGGLTLAAVGLVTAGGLVLGSSRVLPRIAGRTRGA